MPFKSKKQQKWMFANHPKMAKRWAHETPNIKHLPEAKMKKKGGKKGGKKDAMMMDEKEMMMKKGKRGHMMPGMPRPGMGKATTGLDEM